MQRRDPTGRESMAGVEFLDLLLWRGVRSTTFLELGLGLEVRRIHGAREIEEALTREGIPPFGGPTG